MSSVARRAASLAAAILAAALVALAAPAGAAAPKRIVALTPFSANTLASVGVKPIAIGQSLGGRERFLPSLRRVRALPLAHPNGPNMEQLASLEPGLVFSSPTWRKGARTMRSLDIKVVEADPRYGRDMLRQHRADRGHRRPRERRPAASCAAFTARSRRPRPDTRAARA